MQEDWKKNASTAKPSPPILFAMNRCCAGSLIPPIPGLLPAFCCFRFTKLSECLFPISHLHPGRSLHLPKPMTKQPSKVIKPKISEVPPMVAFWNFSDFDSDALQDRRTVQRGCFGPTVLRKIHGLGWLVLRGVATEMPHMALNSGKLREQARLTTGC